MVTADIKDGRIHITAPLHCNDALKAIPGSEYRNRNWTVPLSWASCLRLRAVFGSGLSVGPDLSEWATTEKHATVDPAMALRGLVAADGDPRLYDFQRAGVQFLSTVKRALLADEVGSGKTIQVIMTDRPKPILVVAPKSMLFTWQREFEKWAPGTHVTIATGSAAERRAAIEAGDVVIINWENVQRHSRVAPFGGINLTEKDMEPGELNDREWRTVIIDEAHRAKSPKAKQTRAVWAVCHQPTVESVIALTGTPIANQLDELWAIMHAVNPAEYPSKSKWVTRYAEMGWNMFGGLQIVGVKPETSVEFFSILDYRFRRMPKSVTMPSLPPVRGGLSDPDGLNVRLVEMDTKQRKAYEQMRDTMVAELEGGTLVTTTPLIRTLRMMQFASAYAEMDDEFNIKLADPSCKVDALVDLMDEYDGEPLVVFAASRQLIDLASARLTKMKVKHGLVVGGQSVYERQEHIDAFQAGKLPAILCVTAAGSTGITLTRSRVEVILQRHNSLIENLQMEGRVHRIGSEQHENVTYIDVVSKGTIEPKIVEALYRKDDNLQEICRDAATLAALLKGE